MTAFLFFVESRPNPPTKCRIYAHFHQIQQTKEIHKNMLLFKYKLSRLFFIFVATLLPSLSLANFSDVTEEHPLNASINFSEEQDIIIGYPDGTFRPNDLVNRAEFTKILMRYANATPFIGENCFPKVNNEWFAQYVCSAQKRNFISGYPDGTFRPENSINFAEVAKITINSLQIPHNELLEGDDWFIPFIKALDSRDAIPSSVTSPEQLVTRSELTDIIYRLYLYQNKETSEISPPSSHTSTTINETVSANAPSVENDIDDSEEISQIETSPFDTSTTIEEIVISNTPSVETNIETVTSNDIYTSPTSTNNELFTLESEIQLSFSLLNIFEPQKTNQTTLNIDGTEYLLSVEPKFEKYSIESVPGKNNIYKVIRTVDRKTFANSSQTACEKVNGDWQNNSLCLLGHL